MATTDGSFRTIPFPFTYTKTDAVPRSIPISFVMDILTPPHLIFLSYSISGFPANNHTVFIILAVSWECNTNL